MKAIIVYYSRTGSTKKVAEKLHEKLEDEGKIDIDIEPLVTKKYDAGVFGFLAAGFDAVMKTNAPVRKWKHDPSSHDIAIIGTPIWAGTCSDPVLKYLNISSGSLNKVAFFCTHTFSGGQQAFQDMERACKVSPVGTIEISEADIKYNRYSPELNDFIARITGKPTS